MGEIILEKYNITYGCGCVHEIKVPKDSMHTPTGNNKDCDHHKGVNEND